MVALSLGIRNEACPLQHLLSALLGRPVLTRVYEDNQATISAAQKGYSPTLRHLARHQRCALSVVHETFWVDEDASAEEHEARRIITETLGEMRLEHKESSVHKADGFTKELPKAEFINSTCTVKGLFIEVSQPPLPFSPGDATGPRLQLQSLGIGDLAPEQGRRSQQGDERDH